MNSIKKILDKFVQSERWICSFMLIIMTIITFVQVVLRYCFNSPFTWAEEIILMMLVWFGYICMSLDIYTDTHTSITFFYDRFPPIIKKIADIIRHVLLGFFFVNMVFYGYKLTMLSVNKNQPASGFSQAWLFAPLLVVGVFMVIYSCFNLIMVFNKSDNKKEEAL